MKGSGARMAWGLTVEVTPAAIFGAATGFAIASALGVPPLAVAPLSGGTAAFGGVWILLHRLGSSQARLRLPEFDLEEFVAQTADLEAQEPAEFLDELVLDEELPPPPEDELVLEDALGPPEEDSRVVQLFSREQSPTAGELQAQIEQHLRTAPRPPMPDATQELHDALAALRRSLR